MDRDISLSTSFYGLSCYCIFGWNLCRALCPPSLGLGFVASMGVLPFALYYFQRPYPLPALGFCFFCAFIWFHFGKCFILIGPVFIMACIVNFYKHQGHFYTNNDIYYKKIKDIISFWYLFECMIYILHSNLISPKLIHIIMHFEFKSCKFS